LPLTEDGARFAKQQHCLSIVTLNNADHVKLNNAEMKGQSTRITVQPSRYSGFFPLALRGMGVIKGRTWQDSVMPIRVARFAIDDHTPHRDLYLSPLHCIFFNEALIPVMYLINETSIAQGTPSDMSAIEYYHIDLDTHEVIYAEASLVESFWDEDGSSRENFSNFAQYARLYGGERQSKMTPFAPILRYRGRREELKGLVKSLISNVVDVRDPIQIAYDQLAKRAEAVLV
jgi:hypothetical protein